MNFFKVAPTDMSGSWRRGALWALASVLIAFAPTLARGQEAPFRASLVAPFPALVQQYDRHFVPSENELFPLDDKTASVVLIGLRKPLELTESLDIAEALLTDEQRMLASALDGWIKAPGVKSADRRRQRAAIAAFYAARAYEPLWRDSSTEGRSWLPAALSVSQRLRSAGEDGLDLREYSLPVVDQGVPNVEEELALSEAVAAYAAQAAGARVDPTRISHLIGARPSLPETSAVLTTVVASGAQAGDVLLAFNPPHYGYQLLKAKLAELRGERAAHEPSGVQLALADSAHDDGPSAASRSPTQVRRAGARVKLASRSRSHRQYGALALAPARSRRQSGGSEHPGF